MHYSVLVIAPSLDDVPKELNRFKHSQWDWYQIGGRWTGLFDGYSPEKDPANIEVCNLCSGTGVRKDMEIPGPHDGKGCNGCRGEGKRVKWPTEWSSNKGDVILVIK